MQVPMRRGAASLVAVGVAALLAGCADKEDRICRQSGPAEVCLVGGSSSYELEGRGFLPGSDATVTVGGGGQPLVIQVGRDGRMPAGGMAGVLGGAGAQDVVIAGAAEGGQPVTFELVVPATG